MKKQIRSILTRELRFFKLEFDVIDCGTVVPSHQCYGGIYAAICDVIP